MGGDPQFRAGGLGIGGQGGVVQGVHQVPQLVLHGGLADTEGLHRPGGDDTIGEFLQVGDHPVAEHHLALPGGTGEHEHVAPVGLKGHAGGGAPVILQHSAPLGEHGLLEVVFSHGPLHLDKAVTNSLGRGLVEEEPLAEGLGQSHLGQVVAGRTQTAGGDDDIRTGPGNVHRLADPLRVVPHHGVVKDVDAQLGQALGDHLGVGVCNVAQQQFRADGDEFSGMAHRVSFL